MKDYFFFYEQAFMNFSNMENNPSIDIIKNDIVRGKQIALFGFNETDISTVRETINFDSGVFFYVFDIKNNVYELSQNEFKLSDSIKRKVNAFKGYSNNLSLYNKVDKVRSKEYLKYNLLNENKIVENKSSVLFRKFRRCKFYCKDDGFCCRFRLRLPHKTDKRQPLIIFFDGAGSAGFDNTKQMFNLIPIWKKLNKSNEDCCIVAPQLDKTQSYNTDEFSYMLWQLVNEIADNYCLIDFSRIYLVGVSYGGYGVIYEAFRHPERYAAAVETVGWYYYNLLMRKWDPGDYGKDKYHIEFDETGYKALSKTPFWLACSKLELEYTKSLYNKLKDITKNVKFTRNDKHGHYMFKNFYRNMPWDEWLFSFKKDSKME